MPDYRIASHRSHVPGREWARFQAQWQEATDRNFARLLEELRKDGDARRCGIESGVIIPASR